MENPAWGIDEGLWVAVDITLVKGRLGKTRHVASSGTLQVQNEIKWIPRLKAINNKAELNRFVMGEIGLSPNYIHIWWVSFVSLILALNKSGSTHLATHMCVFATGMQSVSWTLVLARTFNVGLACSHDHTNVFGDSSLHKNGIRHRV